MSKSKIEKAIKLLGEEMVTELGAMSDSDLKKRIVEANEAMRQVDDELEANEAYQRVREDLKNLTAGKREVNARQKAVILVSLANLQDDEATGNANQ